MYSQPFAMLVSIISLGSRSKHVRVRESVSLTISFRQGTFPCTCLLAGKLLLASIQGKSFVFFACVCWQLPVTHSPSETATYQHIHGITNISHIIYLPDEKCCCRWLLRPKNRKQKMKARDDEKVRVLTVTISWIPANAGFMDFVFFLSF